MPLSLEGAAGVICFSGSIGWSFSEGSIASSSTSSSSGSTVAARAQLLLLELYESKEDWEMAEAACRVLFRLDKKDPGRPKYPEFSWGSLPYF